MSEADDKNPKGLPFLPKEIQDKIMELRDQGRTIMEIVAALAAIDVKTSKSAVGNYLQKKGKLAERLRATRELAKSIGRDFGDAENSAIARTNIELLHDIMMGVLMATDDDPEAEPMKPAAIMQLAVAAEKLTKASKTDIEKELKVALERERRATKEKAAEAAAETAKKQGLSRETVEAIKKSVLGIE